MVNIFKRLTMDWHSPFKTSAAMIALVVSITPALAGYTPPSEPSSPRTITTSTGRRGGCNGITATSLTALAPYSHVGQTHLTHPTVAWFVPESETRSLEFFLYRYEGEDGNAYQLIHKAEMESTPGVMTYSLPSDHPGLETGHYRWQAVLICNPNRPSNSLVADAEIQVVAAPDNPALENAESYADAGFWYDALGMALASPRRSNPPEWTTLVMELAHVEDAAGLEERATTLRQVIEQVQP